MSKDELIKILEEYEMFVDDDFGGSYESIIAYAPNKTISRAHTPIAVLNIIDTFEKIQQENKKYKEVINNLKDKLMEYFEVGRDSYFYVLTRDKSAFDYGTMSFDDFIEFSEEQVDDIVDFLKEVEHE